MLFWERGIFSKKKMRIGPRLGQIGEMVIKRGWVIMSLGKESDIVTAVYSKRYVNDYEIRHKRHPNETILETNNRVILPN